MVKNHTQDSVIIREGFRRLSKTWLSLSRAEERLIDAAARRWGVISPWKKRAFR